MTLNLLVTLGLVNIFKKEKQASYYIASQLGIVIDANSIDI